MTTIETLTILILLSNQKTLQSIAVYPSHPSYTLTLKLEGREHHTTLTPNHHFLQCRTIGDDQRTCFPTQRTLANLNGLDGRMILALEGGHVGEGEGGTGEGAEVGESREIDGRNGIAIGELNIKSNLHKRRRKRIRDGEVVGGGSNELFECGGVCSSNPLNTLTLSNQCVNIAKRSRQIDFNTVTNV